MIFSFRFCSAAGQYCVGVDLRIRKIRKILNDDEELRNWLEAWFSSKDEAFYRFGISKLPERWETVVKSGGEYITD